jgi:hypothetical protein
MDKDKIKRVKKSYEYYKVDVKEVDSYGDKNIGTRILRSRNPNLLNNNLELKIKHNK